jgi:hypothetical protein
MREFYMRLFQVKEISGQKFMNLIKSNMKKMYIPILLPTFVSILGTLFIFRSTFFQPYNLPGDLGDARAVISYVNHWPSFFRGNIGLTDTNYFWPLNNGIAGTDLFLLNGIMAFILQLLGMDLVYSVIATFVLITFFGLIGAFKVFNLRIQSSLSSSLLTIAVSTSYALNAQLGHLQLLSTLLIFWVLYFFMLRKDNLQNVLHPFSLLGVLSWLILFLTSWYAAFFLLLTTTIYFFWLFVSQARLENLRMVRDFFIIRNFTWTKSIYILLTSIFTLVLLSLVVYAPKLFSDQTRWPWTEVMLYAPRLGDLINTSTGHQGWVARFNEVFHLNGFPTYERAMGLVPLLFIVVLVMSISIFARPIVFSKESRVVLLTLLSILVLPIVDELGRSPWWFVWQLFPGASAIRSNARIWILASWLALYLMARYFAEVKSLGNRRIIFPVIIILISIMSIRDSQSFWKSENYVSTNSSTTASEIVDRGCTAFFLVPVKNGQAIPLIQYEAMAISEITGVPTLNGSSARNPENYNLHLADDKSAPAMVAKWINANESKLLNSEICIFSE